MTVRRGKEGSIYRVVNGASATPIEYAPDGNQESMPDSVEIGGRQRANLLALAVQDKRVEQCLGLRVAGLNLALVGRGVAVIYGVSIQVYIIGD